jgi:gamma-glutamylaminecyclotransferase
MTTSNLITDEEHLIFVYGTLKRGQPNANIMQRDDIKYIGRVRTFQSWPLVIATTFNIPFLIGKQGNGQVLSFLRFSLL